PPMNLLPIDAQTVAGIRPEHLLVNPDTTPDDLALDLTVTIEHLEYLGSEWLAYGTVQSGLAITDRPQHVVARLPATAQPDCATGQQCRMVAGQSRVCLFDAESGGRKVPAAGAVA